MRIIIAEDEHLCLMGLKASLMQLGHKVIGVANDGKEAVKIALEKTPDLILMDINMPLVDGIEAIKRINQKKFIPSIIVTGYYDDEVIKRVKEVGVFGYLVKPVSTKDLKGAIEITMARFEEFKKIKNDLKDTQKALEARKYIEKAKGILMEKKDLSEAKAMERLQSLSRNNNKKLVVIAKEVIKADELLG